MGMRGRKSKEALQIPQVITMKECPHELVGAQREVWKTIMADVPQDRVTAENVAVVTQLCRHLVTARKLAVIINYMEAEKVPPMQHYEKLLKMRERETKQISLLSAKLRIGIEGYNRAHEKKARRAAIEATPWESE